MPQEKGGQCKLEVDSKSFSVMLLADIVCEIIVNSYQSTLLTSFKSFVSLELLKLETQPLSCFLISCLDSHCLHSAILISKKWSTIFFELHIPTRGTVALRYFSSKRHRNDTLNIQQLIFKKKTFLREKVVDGYLDGKI